MWWLIRTIFFFEKERKDWKKKFFFDVSIGLPEKFYGGENRWEENEDKKIALARDMGKEYISHEYTGQ